MLATLGASLAWLPGKRRVEQLLPELQNVLPVWLGSKRKKVEDLCPLESPRQLSEPLAQPSPAQTQQLTFDRLPDDVVQRVLSFLDAEPMQARAAAVCKRFRRLMAKTTLACITLRLSSSSEQFNRSLQLIERWTSRIRSKKVASAAEMFISIAVSQDPGAFEFGLFSASLAGLFGAAARSESFSRSLTSVVFELSMPHATDDVDEIQLAVDACTALAERAPLRRVSVRCSDAPYQASPVVLELALQAFASSLRVLELPASSLLSAGAVGGIVGAAPQLLELSLAVAEADAQPSLYHVARLACLESLVLACRENHEAALAALATGPAADSLRRLEVVCTEHTAALSAAALGSVARLEGLTDLSVPVDRASAAGLGGVAGLPHLRSLRLHLRAAAHDDDGGALSHALVPLLRASPLRSLELRVLAAPGPPAARPFDSEAFAALVAASRPALTAVSYDAFVEDVPTAKELEALAACPALHTLAFRHGVGSIFEIGPYRALAGRRLPRSCSVTIGVRSPRDGANLAGRCRALLAAWLDGCTVDARLASPDTAPE